MMAATIRLPDGAEATVSSYQWTSSDDLLAWLLQLMIPPDGPSGADPNPDYHVALAAVEELGGKVVSYEKTEYEEGVIY